MTIADDTVATLIAALTTTTATPIAPFGYGTDLSCTTDLTLNMDEVDPFSTAGIAEAVIRRLDCPRGALPGDLDYGFALVTEMNNGIPASRLASIAGQIRSEVEKDDRIQSAAVTASLSVDAKTLTVRIDMKPADYKVGSFSLVLAVTSATIVLQEIAKAA